MPGKGRRRGGGGSNFMSSGLAHNKQAARDRERRQRDSDRADRQRQRGWVPRSNDNPDVGVVAGTDHVVSFKTKDDQDRVIIADGDYGAGDADRDVEARDAFDEVDGVKQHNDYGRRREGGGYFAEDRGHYTGPDH